MLAPALPPFHVAVPANALDFRGLRRWPGCRRRQRSPTSPNAAGFPSWLATDRSRPRELPRTLSPAREIRRDRPALLSVRADCQPSHLIRWRLLTGVMFGSFPRERSSRRRFGGGAVCLEEAIPRTPPG